MNDNVTGCDGASTTCSQRCVLDSRGSPSCSCVDGYTPHPEDSSRCVADAWALPGVLLVYNEATQLKAFNLSALSPDRPSHSRRLRSSTVLYTASRHIDAVGTCGGHEITTNLSLCSRDARQL